LTLSLEISPIGFARTAKKLKFDAPHQPDPSLKDLDDHIELINDQKIIRGTEDLDGFSHIWLIWWFHKNQTWKTKVLPPRGQAKRRGVFATRSPHRPNFLGMTAVPLIKIEKNKLFIGSNDLVDGTPIFDIKPYLAPVDSIPTATLGWTQPLYNQSAGEYEIKLSNLAATHLEFLREKFNVDFTERAFDILKTDPFPHRTRRIVKFGDDQFRMGCGAWRLFYTVSEKQVSIIKIGTGFPLSLLTAAGYDKIPDRNAQLAFLEKFTD
jgi:tRNA-Thr(GGU) m(6)t(6)A37 methyltransferase TsaA